MESKKLILFVNGYTLGCKPYRAYWTEKGNQFLDAADQFFGGKCTLFFINGEGPWYSSAESRKRRAIRELQSKELNQHIRAHDEVFIVTHSMGAAYAEGLLEQHDSLYIKTKKVIHFASADAAKLHICKRNPAVIRIQIMFSEDKTLNRKHWFISEEKRKIKEVNAYALLKVDLEKLHPNVSPNDLKKWDVHYDTKTFAYVWDVVRFVDQMRRHRMGIKPDSVDFMQLEVNGDCLSTDYQSAGEIGNLLQKTT